MSISLPPGAARLRRRLPQPKLTITTISRHIIASSVNKTHVPRQHIRLTGPTQASPKHHVQLVQSRETISSVLLHPANSQRNSFAQTPSSVFQPEPLIHHNSQASRLGGVSLHRTSASILATRKSVLLSPSKSIFPRCSLLTHLSAFAMSTLSQPQTPAALDSPLREHRHRPVERLTDRLETPSLDNRSYRVIRLPNQLEVLLVHDAETDKASAAMDVNVGNFSDEEDLPGTAHAVECESLFTLFHF